MALDRCKLPWPPLTQLMQHWHMARQQSALCGVVERCLETLSCQEETSLRMQRHE
jgi:hypothetical protein